ncbi:MAG: hypothetical protein HWD57_17900 [Candidatus Accumulibacter cognatus]|uniref:Uncharacterized protein n=1 Tax=Candidatus Accumulibacter cognatus TaxID=2954383 RepID=A0A7D5ND65_9PROT|nr:MAG: hypothetical protein HWD57_17900 [Candidatus Accumulibacter cognatus]
MKQESHQNRSAHSVNGFFVSLFRRGGLSTPKAQIGCRSDEYLAGACPYADETVQIAPALRNFWSLISGPGRKPRFCRIGQHKSLLILFILAFLPNYVVAARMEANVLMEAILHNGLGPLREVVDDLAEARQQNMPALYGAEKAAIVLGGATFAGFLGSQAGKTSGLIAGIVGGIAANKLADEWTANQFMLTLIKKREARIAPPVTHLKTLLARCEAAQVPFHECGQWPEIQVISDIVAEINIETCLQAKPLASKRFGRKNWDCEIKRID